MAWYKNSDLVLGCTTLTAQRINRYIFSSCKMTVCIGLLFCPECGLKNDYLRMRAAHTKDSEIDDK